jgi:hypothetical protein
MFYRSWHWCQSSNFIECLSSRITSWCKHYAAYWNDQSTFYPWALERDSRGSTASMCLLLFACASSVWKWCNFDCKSQENPDNIVDGDILSILTNLNISGYESRIYCEWVQDCCRYLNRACTRDADCHRYNMWISRLVDGLSYMFYQPLKFHVQEMCRVQ